MKLTQIEFAALMLTLGAGVYYVLKTRNVSTQFEAAYNTLAGQIASGKLVMSTPTASSITP